DTYPLSLHDALPILAGRNHSGWKLPTFVPSRLPGPDRTNPASRLIGYQKPWPLAAAHSTAGTAITKPPTSPPTIPENSAGIRLVPRTTAGMVMPKTNCETMNHGQLTIPRNAGLTTDIAA